MTLTTYRNFDLLLTRAGERYKAIVVDAPAGEESVLFDPPFAADALPRLDGLARGVARGAGRHIGATDDPGPAANLANLGSQLFGAVFGGQVGALLAASLASVVQEGAGLRLRFEQDAAELWPCCPGRPSTTQPRVTSSAWVNSRPSCATSARDRGVVYSGMTHFPSRSNTLRPNLQLPRAFRRPTALSMTGEVNHGL